ncbi:MAG: RNA polymerase sigma factor RpoD, partial [Clostridiales bacterium]|nr:RNA polymerase sigma factor RpoD [Clostridiales bacterium]
MEHTRSEIIKNFIETAKSRGVISYPEIMDALSEIELTPEQIDDVY